MRLQWPCVTLDLGERALQLVFVTVAQAVLGHQKKHLVFLQNVLAQQLSVRQRFLTQARQRGVVPPDERAARPPAARVCGHARPHAR